MRFISIARTVAVAFVLATVVSACSAEDSTPTEQAEPNAESNEAPPAVTPHFEVDDVPQAAPTHDQLVEQLETALSAFQGSASVAYRSLADTSDPGFSIAGDTQHTAASMIKLVVLAELFDQVSDGTLSLDAEIALEPTDIVGGSGTLQYQGAGTQITLEELARVMIAESDNTATNKIIDIVGMDKVNEEAGKLGLAHTKLQRRMLDESAQANGIENVMSADDAATILLSIAQGTFYGPELSGLALDFLKQQSDESGLLAGLPAGTAFAHKTGMLSGVQNDGGIVLSSKPYVLVMFVEDVDNGQALELMATISSLIAEDLAQ